MLPFGDHITLTTDEDGDGDLAFELQLAETIEASLLIQSKETLEIDPKIMDSEVAKSETQDVPEDLDRRIYDEKGDWGSLSERSNGEVCSSSNSNFAVAMNVRSSVESIGFKTCTICMEDRNVEQIFSIDGCAHLYCFSCMKQHVEVKLLHGMLPYCPHESCITPLDIESCRGFLTPELIEIMSQRIKEASIPPTERVYCPYPECSTLMSKNEVLECSKRDLVPEMFGARKCVRCDALFCINCRVPWHSNLSCTEYKDRNPHQPEEAKLKSLAATNKWRQCVKCSHMIELAEGCYHMTCRCGYEFCYTCGAEWRNGEATCSCSLYGEDELEEEYEDPIFDEEEEDHRYRPPNLPPGGGAGGSGGGGGEGGGAGVAAGGRERITINDAVTYVNQVKDTFKDQMEIYQRFLDLLRNYTAERTDIGGVTARVKELLKGHPTLIHGFNMFVPEGYQTINLTDEDDEAPEKTKDS